MPLQSGHAMSMVFALSLMCCSQGAQASVGCPLHLACPPRIGTAPMRFEVLHLESLPDVTFAVCLAGSNCGAY